MSAPQNQPGGCAIVFGLCVVALGFVWFVGTIRDCTGSRKRPSAAQIEAQQEDLLRAVNEGEAAGTAFARSDALGARKARSVLDRMSERAAADAGFTGNAAQSYARAWRRGYDSVKPER